MGKEIVNQVQEAQRISGRVNQRRNTLKHIVIELTKIKDRDKIFEEIIAENFLNMGKKIVIQLQQAQRVPGRINPRRNTSRHTVIKLTKIKNKDKRLKAQGENDK